MKKTTLTLGLALASIALLSTSANAASAGDLVLGFVTTSSATGGSYDLEADLGPVSLFAATTDNQVINLTYGSSGLTGNGFGSLAITDLSLYGSDTSIKVAAAESNTTTDEVFLTNKSASTAPALSLSNPGATSIYTLIAGVNTAANGTNGAALTGDDVKYLTSATNSYNAVSGGTSGNFSGQGSSSNGSTGTQATLNLSTDSAISFSLYDEPIGSTGNAIDIGTFTLTPSGLGAGLTFDGTGAEVAPEPSTYALGLMGLLALAAFRRRMTVRA